MHKYILFLTAFLLSGCAAHQELQDMKQAKADYKACVADNPKNPAACKQEKEKYETAGEAYDSLRP